MRNFIHWLWMFFCHKLIMRPFFKVILGGDYYLNPSIKSKTPYIIVANHSSHVDTLAILSSLPSHNIHKLKPVAAKDYFARSFIVKYCSKLFINVLLIDRKDPNSRELTIQSMIRSLKEGNNLLIFPEGTRLNDPTIQPFKSGILAVLKACPDVPYIPAYVESTAKILPKGEAMVVPHNFKLLFGKAFYLNEKISDSENLELMRTQVVKLQEAAPLISSSTFLKE